MGRCPCLSVGGVPAGAVWPDQLLEYDQDVRGSGLHLDTRVVIQAPPHSLQHHHPQGALEYINQDASAVIFY